MKKAFFIFTLLMMYGFTSSAQEKPKVEPEISTNAQDNDKPMTFVSNMPRFKSGQEQMLKYIYDNFEYPKLAIENNIEGMLALQFTVERDSSVSDITILRGLGYGMDEEAIEVIKSMNKFPKLWIPGKHNGKVVRVRMTLPIKIDKDNFKN